MKSILLCEGKSDAIVISYYLQSVKGWQFYGKKDKRSKVNIQIKDKDNEEVNWYLNGEGRLAIWGVGGKDRFEDAIQHVLEINELADEGEEFNKIIIITDRDQSENDKEVLKKFSEVLGEVNLRNNDWTEFKFTNEFGISHSVKILPIIIPFNKAGALETFLLDAISEMGEEESHIVKKSKEYIASFELSKYLNTQRLKVKGEMAVALATLFPQKTYTPMDELLTSIKWEEYKAIQEGFRKLEEI